MASPSITTPTTAPSINPTAIATAFVARLNASIAYINRDAAMYQRVERVEQTRRVSLDATTLGDRTPVTHELFNDPTATVVLETCDHVVYRLHDYFLMASSEFFRDMLSNSKPSTSATNPLPLSESSEDWNIVSLIICGRAYDIAPLHKSWTQAARLYEISKKYQFDSHQPWFTEMCLTWLHESPLDALALACNQPEIDEVMAHHAILSLWRADHNTLFQANPLYFRGPAYSPTYVTLSPADLKRWLLDVNNVTLKLGVALGYKGSLAYSYAFAGLGAGPVGKVDSFEDWQFQATKFLSAIREIERQMDGFIVSLVPRERSLQGD